MEKKILFIDDDEILATVNCMILKEKGYDVECRFSLTGIYEYLNHHQPDLLILDVEIGKENSVKVVPELKQLLPHTPILFISSHIAGKDIKAAMAAGGEYYIKKPFDSEELEAYICKMLPKSQQQVVKMDEGYKLNKTTREFYYGNTLIKRLSRKECELLLLLYHHKGETLSREVILREVWANEEEGGVSLNNFISKLRKLFSVERRLTIETVVGEGYKLIPTSHP